MKNELKSNEIFKAGESSELWTAEYSASQKCFHVDTLSKVLDMNRMNGIAGNSVDFQIIGIFRDYDDACKAAEEFRQMQKRRTCRI